MAFSPWIKKMSITDRYLIGDIYQTTNVNNNPNNIFGGVWVRINGRVLVGVDENNPRFSYPKKTGGTELTYTTGKEVGGFGLGVSASFQNRVAVSGGEENMPPFITVYMWERTS